MRLPKTLKICGHKFKITQCTPEELDRPTIKDENALARIGSHFILYGECYPDDLLININKDLEDSPKLETLVHEIFHILCEYTGVGSLFKKGREEHIVQALANAFTVTLLENKSFRELFNKRYG